VITLGNTVLEAATSFRARYFENYWYRDIIFNMWNNDPRVKWIASPKPMMTDNLWDPEFFKWTNTY